MFQGFAFRIKGLLGRWRDLNASSLGENRSKSLQDIPGAHPALLRRFEFVEQILNRLGSDRHATSVHANTSSGQD